MKTLNKRHSEEKNNIRPVSEAAVLYNKIQKS